MYRFAARRHSRYSGARPVALMACTANAQSQLRAVVALHLHPAPGEPQVIGDPLQVLLVVIRDLGILNQQHSMFMTLLTGPMSMYLVFSSS